MIYEPLALLTILLTPVIAFLVGAMLIGIVDTLCKFMASDQNCRSRLRNGQHA